MLQEPSILACVSINFSAESTSLQPLSRSSNGSVLVPTLPTMAAVNLDDVQGDLWNRGFPKFNEVYYFFSIVTGKEREFSKALKNLVSEKDKHISSLTKALADWAKVDGAAKKNRLVENHAEKEIVSTSNALIAFTKAGLDKVSIQPLYYVNKS